jgi:hypothetical protein
MVTNYPQSIASSRPLAGDAYEEGFSGRVMDWLRQTMCGLHGHDTLVQFEQDRMFLRCVSCGHETHGWELDGVRPTVTLRVEAPRKAIAPPQLIRERKIA